MYVRLSLIIRLASNMLQFIPKGQILAFVSYGEKKKILLKLSMPKDINQGYLRMTGARCVVLEGKGYCLILYMQP